MAILGITDNNHRHTRPYVKRRIVVGVPMSIIGIHRCWVDQALTKQHVQLFLQQRFSLSKHHVWAVSHTAETPLRRQLHVAITTKRQLRCHLKKQRISWSCHVVAEPSMAGLGRSLLRHFLWDSKQAWWLVIHTEGQCQVVAFCGEDVCYYQLLDVWSVGNLRQQLLIATSHFYRSACLGVTMGVEFQLVQALQCFSVKTIQSLCVDQIDEWMAVGHASWGCGD